MPPPPSTFNKFTYHRKGTDFFSFPGKSLKLTTLLKKSCALVKMVCFFFGPVFFRSLKMSVCVYGSIFSSEKKYFHVQIFWKTKITTVKLFTTFYGFTFTFLISKLFWGEISSENTIFIKGKFIFWSSGFISGVCVTSKLL